MALGLSFLLVLAACGDDDAERASGSPAADLGAAADGRGGVEAACRAETELYGAFQTELPFPEGDEPTEDDLEAIRAFATDRLGPLAASIVAGAPDDLAEEAATLRAATSDLAESADLTPWLSFSGAYADLTAVSLGLLDVCGDEVVDVVAVDHAFEGLPSTVGPGIVRFHLTNEGTELHELNVIRRPDGDRASLAELMALSGDELFERLDEADRRSAFSLPGGESVIPVDLEPGRYLLLCTVPSGSTGEDVEGDGPLHSSLGMAAELVVE